MQASHSSGSTVLLVSFSRRSSLGEVEIGFRVHETFEVLDLQASVFIGNDVNDENHFAIYLHPDRGLPLSSELEEVPRQDTRW